MGSTDFDQTVGVIVINETDMHAWMMDSDNAYQPQHIITD